MSSVYDSITVDAMKANKILHLCIKSGTTAMMWGKPGVGKTSLAHQVAAEDGNFDSVIVFNPSQDDVIDLKLPYVDNIQIDEDNYAISRFAYSERLPRKGRHLIFVDEINTAPMAMQATLYSLILEGRIGSYKLPPGCIRMAAGNRIEDKCAANDMSLALRDRLGVHMNVIASEKAWVRWATLNGVAPEVVAFVRQNPTALEGINEDDPCAGCTPRSLEFLSNIVKQGIDEDIQHSVVSGVIGRGAGPEFIGFLDIFKNQIDIEQIIEKPDDAPIYKRTDLLYSVVSALGSKMNEDNIDNIFKYLERLNERRYMIMAANDAYNRDKAIMKNKRFNKFLTSNYQYFV
jgi:hypothetical protein